MSTGRQSPSRRWFRGAALVLLGLVAPGAFAQQAPAPTLEEEIRAFCGNIADAARDQRYLLQKKELEELQAASTNASACSRSGPRNTVNG
jgi:flagellar motility protein MotE (MotC chaperone)